MLKTKKLTSLLVAIGILVSMCTVTPVLAAEKTNDTSTTSVAEDLGEIRMYEVPENQIKPFTIGDCEISPLSEYYGDGWFETNWNSPTRYFDGNNIGFTIVTHNSVPSHINTTFTVDLYRKNWIGSSKVGTVTINRSGTYTAEWTNVGSGDYYFRFNKAHDGTRQYIDSIRYYSW